MVCQAQSTPKCNSIYGELAGNGGFASFNYERQLFAKLLAPSLRVGLGFLILKQSFYLTIPIGLHYSFALKNPKKAIETGLSFTYGWVDNRISKEGQGSDFMMLVPNLTYRHGFGDNLFWRIGFTPALSLRSDYAFTPWCGFGIGKRF